MVPNGSYLVELKSLQRLKFKWLAFGMFNMSRLTQPSVSVCVNVRENNICMTMVVFVSIFVITSFS